MMSGIRFLAGCPLQVSVVGTFRFTRYGHLVFQTFETECFRPLELGVSGSETDFAKSVYPILLEKK